MPPKRRSTSKAIHAEANVAESGEVGRQRHKTKAKTQSQNSGLPDTTASSHSSRQSSNDDASNFYSNESTNSKSNSEEEYFSDEGVKLLQGKSMSRDKWAQKCQGLQKEVYNATQEAADLSKRNKILKKAIDKEKLKRDAEYEKLLKKSFEARALKLENSQLQKLKSNFDKELRNKTSEALKEKTNSINHLEDFLKEKKAESKRLNDRNFLLEREQSAIQKTAAK